MVDWPSSPAPSEISAPSFVDPAIEMRTEQGYVARRPRHTRGFKRYRLLYKTLDRDDRVTIEDFIERTARLGGVTFGWTHPYGLTVTGASLATPIVITTQNNHGFQSNDTVVVADVGGNTAANGTWTITRVSATTFSLNASVGNFAYTTGGTAAWRAENLALIALSSHALEPAEKHFGPDQDNEGRWTLTLTFEEQF